MKDEIVTRQHNMLLLGDSVVFSLCLVGTCGVMFIFIYFLVTLSDLECDYLNAQECCTNLNYFVKPKLYAHLLILFLLAAHGHWVLVSANLPMTAWIFYELMRVPRSNTGVYDPTEILNWGQIHKHMKRTVLSMTYYLALFLAYFYCMIVSLLKGNPLKTEKKDFEVDM